MRAMSGQMRREETIRGNPVLVTVIEPRPPTMAEELWVQETMLSLSLTVVLVTMESKGATVAADTA